MFTTGLLGEILIQPRMERTDSYQVADTLDARSEAPAVEPHETRPVASE